jgi:hypothetical protein
MRGEKRAFVLLCIHEVSLMRKCSICAPFLLAIVGLLFWIAIVGLFFWLVSSVWEYGYPKSTSNDEGSITYSIHATSQEYVTERNASRMVECKHNGVGGKPPEWGGFLHLDRVHKYYGPAFAYESQKWQLLGPDGNFQFLHHIVIHDCNPAVAELSVRVYRRTAEEWEVVDIIQITPANDGWYRATFGAPDQQPVFIPVSSQSE